MFTCMTDNSVFPYVSLLGLRACKGYFSLATVKAAKKIRGKSKFKREAKQR